MKDKYRIMSYDYAQYTVELGYIKIRKYIPQELCSCLWGLFTWWENLSEYGFEKEKSAEKIINDLKLAREINKNPNIKYENK